MSRLADITRRDLLFSSLAGATRILIPAGLLEAEEDQSGKNADFYRVLEDARIAYCWQEHSRAHELYVQALKLLPRSANTAVTAEILEDVRSLRTILRDASDTLARRLAAIKAWPEDCDQRLWLGWTLSQLGRYEEAVEQFNAVVRLADPTWLPAVRLELGWRDYRRGEYASALRWFLEARGSGQPNKLDVALAYVGAGDRSEAHEDIILAYAALSRWKEVESETREYIRHFGRLPWPERRTLRRMGFDTDAVYVELQRRQLLT